MLCNPNGIRINLYSLRFEVKVVSSGSFSSIFTCQYPLLSSNVENTVASSSESMHSFIRGTGCKSRFVRSWRLLLSTEHRSVPSFFGAKTVFSAHSVCAGFTTSCPIMLSISIFSNSLVFELARYRTVWTGFTVHWKSLIHYFATFMLPRSASHTVWILNSTYTNSSR